MQTILVLCLLSPVAEAFPNLYMSWWAPSNGQLQRYLDTWPRRVAVVFVVWLPILITLTKVIDPPGLIWMIGGLVFSAFGLRLYVFDRSLSQELDSGSSAAEPSKLPELLYLVAFSAIGVVLYGAVPGNQWLVPVAILTIFLGASMMAKFRRGRNIHLALDVLGRSVFVIGFLLNLYNLDRAVSSATFA